MYISEIPLDKYENMLYILPKGAGLELDVILQTKFGIIGMEIKNRKTLAPVDIKPMRDVDKGLDKEWIVVYRGDEIRKISEPHIWAVPSHRLF